MEVRHDYIYSKPGDFKVCRHCNRINWYENEICIECGETGFVKDEKKVKRRIEDEYKFYKDVEGYTEEEIDEMFTEV